MTTGSHRKLEPVGGAVSLDSEFYIIRPADEQFRAAIARLPKKQRAALILRMYHDMSHQEIADAIGSSVGAVKANFFHALGNLKKLLGDEK